MLFRSAISSNPLSANSPNTLNDIGYVNDIPSLYAGGSSSTQTDGGLYVSSYSTSWYHQIFGDFRTGSISVRGKLNGTWQSWRSVPTIAVSDSAPSIYNNGDFWWQSSTGKLKICYYDGSSTQWVDALPMPDMSTYYSKAGGAISGDVVIGGSLTSNGIARFGGSAYVDSNAIYHAGTFSYSSGVNASHVVQRDANGYIYANYINHSTSETENPTVNSIFVSNGDGWTRKASQAHIVSQLGLWTTGNIGSVNESYRRDWGLFSTNGGQDFLGRSKRCIVATTGNMVINYGGDFSAVEIQSNLYSGIMYRNGNTGYYCEPGGTSVFSALTVGGNSVITSQYNSSLNSDSRNSRGVTRLYRRDSDSDYSVQTYWTGSYWRLYGYNGDSGHADTHVGYADSAGNASSISNAVGGSYVWTNANFFRSNPGSGVYIGSTSSPSLQAYSTDGGAAYMSFHRSGSYAVNMGLDPDNVLRIGGWSASSNRLVMDMSGNLTMAGNVTAYSDVRLKENIEVITDALDKVNQIRGVTFTRNDHEDKERRHAGVIAQEVELVLPEVVSTDNEGIKNVAYGNMVGLLIEAIKEQQKQIDELKIEISKLK